MVRDIYLIRHGETEGSGEPRYKGSIDVPLSERGMRQAEATASYMKEAGLKPAVVYCSDLSRAVKTAGAVASVYGLTPVIEPGFRERHFGRWEGMTFNEIKAQYPDEFGAWAADPLRSSPLDGESTLHVHKRVVAALETVLNANPDGHIAIIAHGGVNRVVLCHYMGLPLDRIFSIEQDFACLNIIRFHDGFPVLKLMNAVFYQDSI